nr:MAG TPA: hypothetical protein [Caudoviricetes sp.]
MISSLVIITTFIYLWNYIIILFCSFVKCIFCILLN